MGVVSLHDASTDRFLHAVVADQSPLSLTQAKRGNVEAGTGTEDASKKTESEDAGKKSPFDQSTENDFDEKARELETTNNANVDKSMQELDKMKDRSIHGGRSIGELSERMRALDTNTQEFVTVRNEAAQNYKAETNLFETFRVGAIERAVNDTTKLSLEQQKAQQALIDAAQGAVNDAGQWIADKRHVSDLGKVSTSLQEMYPGKSPAQVWKILDIDQDQKLSVNELFQALYNLGRNRLSEKEARDVASDTYSHLGRLMGSGDMQQTRNVFFHAFSSNEDGSTWLAPHMTPHSSEGAKEVDQKATSLLGTIGPGQVEVVAHRQANKTDHSKMGAKSPGTVKVMERKL